VKTRSESRSSYNFGKPIHVLISLAVFLAISVYVYHHADDFEILLEVRWSYAILLIGMSFLLELSIAARFNSLYRALGVQMGLLESFGLSVVASTCNTFLPAQAGGIIRAVYLKRQHSILYSQFPAIFLGNIVFSFFLNSIIILITGTVVTLSGGQGILFLGLGAALIGLSTLLFIVRIPEWMLSRLGHIGRMLRMFSDSWKTIRSNRRCLLHVCLYQLLAIVVRGVGLTVAYRSLGLSMASLVGISIVTLANLLSIVNITPGNLGITEGVVGLLSRLSGMTFVQGAAAFVLWRVAKWLVRFLIAPIAWYFLFYRKNIQVRSKG